MWTTHNYLYDLEQKNLFKKGNQIKFPNISIKQLDLPARTKSKGQDMNQDECYVGCKG